MNITSEIGAALLVATHKKDDEVQVEGLGVLLFVETFTKTFPYAWSIWRQQGGAELWAIGFDQRSRDSSSPAMEGLGVDWGERSWELFRVSVHSRTVRHYTAWEGRE